MKNTRPVVPRNVERQLWSESCGFCMNPECSKQLVSESAGQNIGQMAHIVPHAQGGNVSVDNLILLCANCHLGTEPLRTQNGEARLRSWKAQAKQRIEQQFSECFSSFELLEERFKPILERNHLIFSAYGSATNQPEKHQLWLKFESELIANNSKLKCWLTNNLKLLHKNNHEVVKEFVLHAGEFVQTREDEAKTRSGLFPSGLLSMFGIEPESSQPAQNVSALQNFISRLNGEENFTDLNFFPEPTLKYIEDGEPKCLSLNDTSRVQQIFFSRRLYYPRKTELRLGSMMFFLDWFTKNGIEWKFEDYCDLTTLTLKDTYRVKMFYSYCLSISDLHNTALNSVGHVVNLHSWNNGPSSNKAMEYACSLGIKIYNQNQFFTFCHNNVK